MTRTGAMPDRDASTTHPGSISRSLPDLLRDRAQRTPDAVALRTKRLGRWEETTWSGLSRAVAESAAWLTGLGVGHGDTVALLGSNSAHWVQWFLAAQAVGAVATGVAPEASGSDLEHVLRIARPVVVVVDTVPQAEDALLMRERSLIPLMGLVSDEPLEVSSVRVSGVSVTSTTEMRRRSVGERASDVGPQAVDAHDSAADAVLLWTSGTTGAPRGVRFTWHQISIIARQLQATHGFSVDDDAVIAMSLAHCEGFVVGIVASLASGMRVSFPESTRPFDPDLRALRPTVIVAPARWFVRLWFQLVGRTAEAPRLNAWALRTVMHPRGTARASRGMTNAFRRGVVLRPLHRSTGLGQLRLGMCTGGDLPGAVLDGLVALGVPVNRVYSVTELGGLVACNADPTTDGIGTPYPGVDITLGEDGSVMCRSPSAAARFIDGPLGERDGWILTGDRGSFDYSGQFLRITDMNVAAEQVGTAERELALRGHEFVAEVIVVRRPEGWVAVVELDAGAADRWARRHPVSDNRQRMDVSGVAADALRDQFGSIAASDGSPLFDHLEIAATGFSVAAGHLTATCKVRRSSAAVCTEKVAS